MCLPKNEYGTVEYYKNHFSDIIGDAGDDDEDNFARANAIMEGFMQAVEVCMVHHRSAARSFQHLQDLLLYARNASMAE